MSAEDQKPTVGQTDECAVCGLPLRFEGRFWEHVGAQPRHPPAPKSAGAPDPFGAAL